MRPKHRTGLVGISRVGSFAGEELQLSSSKPILTEIDQVLATHYGFTDEEWDFPSIKLRTGIPSTRLRADNYDIKYRMGRDAEADDDSVNV